MEKLNWLFKLGDCTSLYFCLNPPSRYTSECINSPVPLIYVSQKSASPKDKSESVDDLQDIEEVKVDKCFQCESTSSLFQLACSHLMCSSCIELKLKILFSLNKPYLLHCFCGELIKSNLFENRIKSHLLIRYFKETEKIAKQGGDCQVCGHSHENNCLAYFREKNNKICNECFKSEYFLLECGHSFCKECMKTHIEKSLTRNSWGIIVCKFCEGRNAVIPAWVLNQVFDDSEKYSEIQVMFQRKRDFYERKFCMICLAKLENYGVFGLECGDRFCKSCIINYLETRVTEISNDCEIRCPKCKSVIDPLVIQGVVKGSLKELYLGMLMKISKNRKSMDSWDYFNGPIVLNNTGERERNLDIWLSGSNQIEEQLPPFPLSY